MDRDYFHFTLGPVQGFVAQARRTRDFWAGSFLLSWLSGVAMAEIRRQGGEINFPVPACGYIDWITGKPGRTEAPRQGAIPNRFKAVSATVPTGFDGRLLAETVREAWRALADHIWKEDALETVATDRTRDIWVRQHSNFWEIAWLQTQNETASYLLDQRKNWRSHYPNAEPGVKCMVMDGWQELSGAERPGLTVRGEPTEMHRFWQSLRDSKAAGILTDLAENEHLCGIAYVKRRFARHFETFEANLSGGLYIRGWKLDTGVPSVAYMAAVHWLEALLRTASAGEIKAILDAAMQTGASRDEWETRIPCLVKAACEWHPASNKRRMLSLDGNVFFEHVRDNPRSYGYSAAGIQKLNVALNAFYKSHPEFDAPLSPFYAVLLMDGDSLGSHMSDREKQTPISKALERFTGKIPDIVESKNGFLIYAGGDDVLAILPLEDAINCAAMIRQEYLASFAESGIPTTISAAIEYVHVKRPLGKVLGDAHQLLDDVAKEGAGRDALAVRVWKPGGMVLEWAQPWDIALENDRAILEEIAENFRHADGFKGAPYSARFFHRIGEQFDLLNPARRADGSYDAAILDEDDAVSMLAVDYLCSGDNRAKITLDDARAQIRPLLVQCRPVTRNVEEKHPSRWPRSTCLRPDGALLVNFLAEKGVE